MGRICFPVYRSHLLSVGLGPGAQRGVGRATPLFFFYERVERSLLVFRGGVSSVRKVFASSIPLAPTNSMKIRKGRLIDDTVKGRFNGAARYLGE